VGQHEAEREVRRDEQGDEEGRIGE
jgi:hypothetical protein